MHLVPEIQPAINFAICAAPEIYNPCSTANYCELPGCGLADRFGVIGSISTAHGRWWVSLVKFTHTIPCGDQHAAHSLVPD